MRVFVTVLAAAVLLCTGCRFSYCSISGLLIIPTAETVGAQAIQLQYTVNSPVLGESGELAHLINAEYGFGSTIETGVDFDLSSGEKNRVLVNFKYIPWGEPAERAVAVGVYNLGPGLHCIPYTVGTYAMSAFRLTAGLQYGESAPEPFFGVDHILKGRFDVCADWTAGDDNFASAGVCYYSFGDWSAQLGLLLPNSSENERCITFQISWTGRW